MNTHIQSSHGCIIGDSYLVHRLDDTCTPLQNLKRERVSGLSAVKSVSSVWLMVFKTTINQSETSAYKEVAIGNRTEWNPSRSCQRLLWLLVFLLAVVLFPKLPVN